jgi:PII-like signaling protein
MKGICLRFYMNEFIKHRGILMYEWLLELAHKHGIQGGTAIRGIAGYGRRGIMHEEHFFELASNVPVEVFFLLKEEEARKLIYLIEEDNIDLFYSMSPAEFGSTKNLKE